MVDYFERTKKFTNAEFKALPRYDAEDEGIRCGQGRLKDLPEYFWLLTESQVNKLHPDDWTYYYDLQEEVAYNFNELKMEFANA